MSVRLGAPSAVMPLPPASVPSCARAVHAQRGRWLALVEIALCLLLFAACAFHVRLRLANARGVAAIEQPTA